jgi:hypothetical protein
MTSGRVRWQYKIINIGMYATAERLTYVLGRLGEDGWELVHVYDKASNWLTNMEKGFAILKRPVDPGDEPDGPWAEWSREEMRLNSQLSGEDYESAPF